MPSWLASCNHQKQHFMERHLKLLFYSPVYPGSFCQLFDCKGKITLGLKKVWCLKLEDFETIWNWPLLVRTKCLLLPHNFWACFFTFLAFIFQGLDLVWESSTGIAFHGLPFSISSNSQNTEKEIRRYIPLNISLTLHCLSYFDNRKIYAFMSLSKNQKRGNVSLEMLTCICLHYDWGKKTIASSEK